MKPLLALCCSLALALPAPAQTVQRQTQLYRCGPDGRDLRDAPCPGAPAASSAVAITYDEPSRADRQAARARHQADAREAAALAASRRASEAQARQQTALRLGAAAPPPPPARPASSAAAHTAKPPKLARPHKPARPGLAASGSAQPGR
jgi:hypothetical protein